MNPMTLADQIDTLREIVEDFDEVVETNGDDDECCMERDYALRIRLTQMVEYLDWMYYALLAGEISVVLGTQLLQITEIEFRDQWQRSGFQDWWGETGTHSLSDARWDNLLAFV